LQETFFHFKFNLYFVMRIFKVSKQSKVVYYDKKTYVPSVQMPTNVLQGCQPTNQRFQCFEHSNQGQGRYREFRISTSKCTLGETKCSAFLHSSQKKPSL
jgi:hypothetical protein